MAFEAFEGRYEIQLASIAEIKKFLVPFLKRNNLEEIDVQILDREKKIAKFRFAYIHGASQVDGKKDCSPFKPGFVSYLKSLGFRDGMTFRTQPCEDTISSQIEAVPQVVEEVNTTVVEIVGGTTEQADVTIELPSQKGPQKKNKRQHNKRKKPTKAEKKLREKQNRTRSHIDQLRGDRWGIEYFMRILKGVGKPTPDGYLALSSKLCTRITDRDFDAYREELFGEYSVEQMHQWLQTLPQGSKWLDIGAGNTYKNPQSLGHYMHSSHPGIHLTSYDPIYRGQHEFPKIAEFVGGYAQQMPFEDEVFDVITSLHVYDKISDQNEGVQIAFLEALRVLKVGGILKIAPVITLDMIHALALILLYLGEDVVNTLEIFFIADQLNIKKISSFECDTVALIKQKVKDWNETGRYVSKPLSGQIIKDYV